MSTTTGRFLSSMDEEMRERMGKKFDVCFMMAKESLLFTKYPTLLELESRHGVDLGLAYSTPDLAKAFTSYIVKNQRQTFLNTLSSSGSRFFSFLMDVTTDAGNQEDKGFCTALRMPPPKRSLHVLVTSQSIVQEMLMPVVCFRVSMRL